MAMRFRFQAKHTRRHSHSAWSNPRRRNWRKPRTDLMMPNTGSTVCFLSAYALRPAFVLSRYAMHSAAVAVSGNGTGSVKRSRQPTWCSSRATASSTYGRDPPSCALPQSLTPCPMLTRETSPPNAAQYTKYFLLATLRYEHNGILTIPPRMAQALIFFIVNLLSLGRDQKFTPTVVKVKPQ